MLCCHKGRRTARAFLPDSSPAAGADPAHCERANFFAAIGADIRHCGNHAYSNVSEDFVRMPPFETLRDPESYYETLAHECTHWTATRHGLIAIVACVSRTRANNLGCSAGQSRMALDDLGQPSGKLQSAPGSM